MLPLHHPAIIGIIKPEKLPPYQSFSVFLVAPFRIELKSQGLEPSVITFILEGNVFIASPKVESSTLTQALIANGPYPQ